MNQIPEDYTQILLEEIRSHYKALAENIELVKDKGEATFEKVGHMTEDLQTVKDDVLILINESKIHSEELRLIRYELKEKVGRDEFKVLEDRVVRLEKLALSRA
ncbi:MAG: hypothetical protein WC659_01360 [Patescibacteria group bacterium]